MAFSPLRGVALLALGLLALPARAQDTAPPPVPRVQKQVQAKGGRKVIKLEAITIEGRIQKPQAFYILQRSTLNFDELNRAESFLNKVLKSVERDPF
jgi:hypothetical protein